MDKGHEGKKDEEGEPDHIDVEEHVQMAKKPMATASNETRALPEISESIDGMPEELETVTVEETIQVPKAGDGKPSVPEPETKSGFKRRFVPVYPPEEAHRNGSTSRPFSTTTSPPYRWTRSSTAVTSTTTPHPTTTRKNFRRNNDYYSMYYDAEP